jgi:hypothetical protein
MKIIESQNKKYGFYGTIKNCRHLSIKYEWKNAVDWVKKAMPMWTDTEVCIFLDSRYGRHLADEASDANGIKNVSIERWLDILFDFGAEGSDFLPKQDATRINEARKLAREALKNLQKASEIYSEICAAENPNHSESQKSIYKMLRKELNEIKKHLCKDEK